MITRGILWQCDV